MYFLTNIYIGISLRMIKWIVFCLINVLFCILCYSLHLSPVSSVGITSDFRSQGCRFEAHFEQHIFILFAFDALLAGRLVPYK